MSQGTRRAFSAGHSAGRGITRFLTQTVAGGAAKVVGAVGAVAVGFATGVHEETRSACQGVAEQVRPTWKSLAARFPRRNTPPEEKPAD